MRTVTDLTCAFFHMSTKGSIVDNFHKIKISKKLLFISLISRLGTFDKSWQGCWLFCCCRFFLYFLKTVFCGGGGSQYSTWILEHAASVSNWTAHRLASRHNWLLSSSHASVRAPPLCRLHTCVQVTNVRVCIAHAKWKKKSRGLHMKVLTWARIWERKNQVGHSLQVLGLKKIQARILTSQNISERERTSFSHHHQHVSPKFLCKRLWRLAEHLSYLLLFNFVLMAITETAKSWTGLIIH